MKRVVIIGAVLMPLMATYVQGAVPVIKMAAGCQADQSYFLTADG